MVYMVFAAAIAINLCGRGLWETIVTRTDPLGSVAIDDRHDSRGSEHVRLTSCGEGESSRLSVPASHQNSGRSCGWKPVPAYRRQAERRDVVL
jgi:hypothetical protein